MELKQFPHFKNWFSALEKYRPNTGFQYRCIPNKNINNKWEQ